MNKDKLIYLLKINFTLYCMDIDAIYMFQTYKYIYKKYYPLYILKHIYSPIRNIIPTLKKIKVFNPSELRDVYINCIHINELYCKFMYNYDSFDFHYLPERLLRLEFPYVFNHPLLYLPPNLTYLKFGGRFNQNIDNVLPNTLSELYLGGDFNRSFTI